jgi:signal transduction histidine kinase
LAQAEQIIPIGTILSDASRTCSIPGNVQIELACPNETLSIVADGRIHEVFRSLFTNAVQALTPGGGWIQLGAQSANGEVLFWISDNGPGISKEKRESIFDLFYSTKPESLGFGLWDAKRIVLAHGGSIEVESEPGKGTTFKVRLPKSRRPV